MIDTHFGKARASRIDFTGESDRSVADIFREQSTNSDERPERDEAAEWLTEYLTEHGGEMPVGQVVRAGGLFGYSKRLLQKARVAAKIGTRKAGMAQGWVWC